MAHQGLHQVQKLTQNQVLAPQLRQSLKILQAPALELRHTILEELQSNPLLEEMPMDGVSLEQETEKNAADRNDQPDGDNSQELRFQEDFAVLRKLDGFEIIVLDDIGYIQQSRDEMEVLFTFLSERYERRSLMITSNLVFSQWDKIFKDPMTTMAAVDRLVHHATILEFTGDTQRTPKKRQE